jgi:hypothetical protein
LIWRLGSLRRRSSIRSSRAPSATSWLASESFRTNSASAQWRSVSRSSARDSAICTLLGALNSWLILQVKAGISELQLKVETEIGALRVQIAEQRSLNRDTLRHWAEAEFVRKDSLSSQLAALAARLERLEDRRRSEPSHQIK